MAHLLTCPECGKNLQVPENLLGSRVQCPECQHTFTATLPEEESAPSKHKETSDPPAWNKKDTGVGVSKKTKRRDDDDRRRRDDDDDDFDDRPSRRRSSGRGDDKPGKVTGIGIMMLIGGILGVMMFLALGGSSGGLCCLWPGTYYSLVMGILAIIKGSAILGSNAQVNAPPTGIGVMMIINIINLDITNVVLGILVIVFCGDDEVKNYLRG